MCDPKRMGPRFELTHFATRKYFQRDRCAALHPEGTHELHSVIGARDIGIREGYSANAVGKSTPNGPSENAQLRKAMTESIRVDAQVRATHLSERQVGESNAGRHCYHASE